MPSDHGEDGINQTSRFCTGALAMGEADVLNVSRSPMRRIDDLDHCTRGGLHGLRIRGHSLS